MKNRKVSAVIFMLIFVISSVSILLGVYAKNTVIKDLDVVEDKEYYNDVIVYPTDLILGENVKTEINFNAQTFFSDEAGMQTRIVGDYASGWDCNFTELTTQLSYGSFNAYATFVGSGSSSNTFFSVYFNTRIYCGGSGVLTYSNLRTSAETNYTTYQSGTVDINSTLIDAEGYVNIRVSGTLGVGLGGTIKCSLGIVYQTSLTIFNEWEDDISREVIVVEGILFFVRDSVGNSVKSNYRYLSDDVVEHELVVPSVRHAKEIEIYVSEDWEFASISPTAMVGYSGTTKNYKILSPTELIYTICFYSKRESYLALKDISNYW